MKFIITVKNPDSIEDSILRAVEESMNEIETKNQFEYEDFKSAKVNEIWKACEKWVKYKEYISIEIDTTAGTATVCEV